MQACQIQRKAFSRPSAWSCLLTAHVGCGRIFDKGGADFHPCKSIHSNHFKLSVQDGRLNFYRKCWQISCICRRTMYRRAERWPVKVTEVYDTRNIFFERLTSSGLTYGESETSRRQDTSARSDSDDGYSDRSRFPSGPSYPIDPPQPGGYPVSSQYSSGQAYPALAYPAGNSLPPQSSPYPGPSSYGQQMPSYPISARSGPGESHYVYGHDYMAPQDPYGRSSTGHPQAPPREMPMVMDPYYGNPRMDKRDLRPDPRADSRYPPQYMQSPADDVPMGGMDGIRYGDYPPAPPMQNGRGYPVQNTRAPQVGYDRDRNSPGLQYRHEIPREEQRRRDRDRR